MKMAIAAAAALLFATGSAGAQVIASSSFTTSDEGWQNGSFTSLGSTSAVQYNALAGTISVADNYGLNALIAPTAYLGNRSAAFGGSISFQTSVVSSDGPSYSPLALFGAGLTLYANIAPPPGTALTPYSITLTGANFTTDGAYGPGAAATDAQLLSVLGALDRLAIQADWQTGADLVTLDNVVMRGPVVNGAVPEPATWAMLLLGFGVVGGAMRRRRAYATATPVLA